MSGRFILLVRTGRNVGEKLVLEPERDVKVGRVAETGFAIEEDRQLSDVHFVLSAKGRRVTLQSSGTEVGVEVNGLKVDASVELDHGDWIRAADTDFTFHHEAHTPPIDDVEDTNSKQLALSTLRSQKEPLFAVLDAARDERILTILRECVSEARSLYEGFAGEAMADAAPYLVQVGTGPLLERFVLEGWGRSWGIFLTSSRSFVQVRRHLRRFLIVKDDETENRLYFRFYDPRVFRVFLPIATRRQSVELFEDISQFLMENEDESVLHFARPAAASAA